MLGFCVMQCVFTASSRVEMFTRIIFIHFPPRKKDKRSVIKKSQLPFPAGWIIFGVTFNEFPYSFALRLFQSRWLQSQSFYKDRCPGQILVLYISLFTTGKTCCSGVYIYLIVLIAYNYHYYWWSKLFNINRNSRPIYEICNCCEVSHQNLNFKLNILEKMPSYMKYI